jgi:hypothetical protein
MDDFQARDLTVRSRSLAPGDAEALAPALRSLSSRLRRLVVEFSERSALLAC